MKQYIVKDERELGYVLGINENGFARMEVMAVDVINGGDPVKIGRTTCATNYREATKEDEERFSYNLGL